MTEKASLEILVKELCSGSKEAATEIITRFYGAIYNLCYNILKDKNEAEDCAQETFLKMLKNIWQYDQKQPFIPWLFQIAVNTARNMISKKKPHYFFEKEENIASSDIKFDPIETIIKEEKLSQIAAVIEELPLGLKLVMLLKYQYNLDNDKIIKILEISPGALRVRLCRAINFIRKRLKTEKEGEVYNGMFKGL